MPKKGVFIRMDDELRKDLEYLSKKTGKTKSDIIRDALKIYIRRDLKTHKMRGIVKGVKLKEIDEIADKLRSEW